MRYCSTRRAPGSGRFAAAPMPGGASAPRTSWNWRALQAELLAAAATLVAPGGRLVYSVCTITAAESVDHATPGASTVDSTPPDVGTWRVFRQGWRVLPQDADTDGMVLIRYRRLP